MPRHQAKHGSLLMLPSTRPQKQPYLAWLYLSLMAEEWFPALARQKSTCSKTSRTSPRCKAAQ